MIDENSPLLGVEPLGPAGNGFPDAADIAEMRGHADSLRTSREFANAESEGLIRDLTAVITMWPEYQKAVFDAIEEEESLPIYGVVFNRGNFRWVVQRHGRLRDGKATYMFVGTRSLEKPQLSPEEELQAIRSKDDSLWAEENYYDNTLTLCHVGLRAKDGIPQLRFRDSETFAPQVTKERKIIRVAQENNQQAADGAKRFVVSLFEEVNYIPPTIKNVTPTAESQS